MNEHVKNLLQGVLFSLLWLWSYFLWHWAGVVK